MQLPDDIPAGPAEASVLCGAAPDPLGAEAPSRNAALFQFLKEQQTSDHARRSKEEIDAELADERASWEDGA